MGEQPWLVVPTAGRATLAPAIASSGIPPERVVIVATAPSITVPSWCHVIADFGEVNIHRWWNAGLDYAAEHGARWACVINDDVLLDETTVPALVAAAERTGAALASIGGDTLLRDPSPSRRSIEGACWLLDLSSGLRPDESYRWWYGDDDLDWRARRDHGGVALTEAPFVHLHPNALTEATPALMQLTYADAQLWAQRTGVS